MKNILVFPRRGNPPPDQPGYERDPGDLYVFYLPWAPCRHRENRTNRCCGHEAPINPAQMCTLLDEPCDRVKCQACKLPEKGP